LTGGYEDQYDLEKMLNNPTKSMAKNCMVRQIEHWFNVGPDFSEFYSWNGSGADEALEYCLNKYPKVRALKEKYC